jgi:hypothetical protein
MIQQIEKLSSEISSEIHYELHKNADFNYRHLAHYNDFSSIDIKNSILVLGLDPSSSDIDSGGAKKDCFIHYYPESWIKPDDILVIRDFKNKGYTYDKYFKKPYELFLKYKYNPVWTNKTFLQNKKSILTNSEYLVLNRCIDNGKYIIFSDLINYKEKTAKKIESIINSNKFLKEKIISLFILQIEFFNAKVIFINNAFASRIISDFLIQNLRIDKKIYSVIDFKGTKVIFSSILTGARAIDNYSFERLKNEISTIMPSS